jgi:transposase
VLSPTGWYLATAPVDLRCGIDRLLVIVQSLTGTAAPGDAYVFRNRAGTRIRVLLADATGVWLCTRRLHRGSFTWPRPGDAVCAVSRQQFEWLCTGVDWQRLSMHRVLAACV